MLCQLKHGNSMRLFHTNHFIWIGFPRSSSSLNFLPLITKVTHLHYPSGPKVLNHTNFSNSLLFMGNNLGELKKHSKWAKLFLFVSKKGYEQYNPIAIHFLIVQNNPSEKKATTTLYSKVEGGIQWCKKPYTCQEGLDKSIKTRNWLFYILYIVQMGLGWVPDGMDGNGGNLEFMWHYQN